MFTVYPGSYIVTLATVTVVGVTVIGVMLKMDIWFLHPKTTL